MKALFSKIEMFLIRNNRRFVIDSKKDKQNREYRYSLNDKTVETYDHQRKRFADLIADTGLCIRPEENEY